MSDTDDGRRLEIEEMISRGAWALDTGDGDVFADCFTGDGELVEHGADTVTRCHGHREIAAFAAGRRQDPALGGLQHHVGQLVQFPDPKGRADHRLVRSYVFVTRCEPEPPHSVQWVGHYEDIVCRGEDGRWKLRSRQVRPWAGDVLARFTRQTGPQAAPA